YCVKTLPLSQIPKPSGLPEDCLMSGCGSLSSVSTCFWKSLSGDNYARLLSENISLIVSEIGSLTWNVSQVGPIIGTWEVIGFEAHSTGGNLCLAI
ncbi:mCG145473, partial [Mus musculus]